MSKKQFNSLEDLGLVFSTGDTKPSLPDTDHDETTEYTGPPPQQQKPRIYLDRKRRNGKVVTLITDLDESDNRLTQMCKMFKSKCGVGGNAKNGEIILQGDHRRRIREELLKMGYSQTKLAGG